MDARSKAGLLLTDTFRARASIAVGDARSYDMLAIANSVSHRLHNLFSLEMWGGLLDVAMRFLHEDPFVWIAAGCTGDPQHLLPNAAARLERRRVYGVSG